MPIHATIVRAEDGGWDFSWSVGTPPYAIWLDGILLDTVEDEEYEFRLPNYDDVPPDLEILNDGEDSEGGEFPPYVYVQWRGLQNAAGYVVEELVDAVWVTRVTVQETGKGYYRWRSPAHEDEETIQYRVVAVDILGNAGTPIAFTIDIARNPAHPNVTVDIDSNGDVVVSEA